MIPPAIGMLTKRSLRYGSVRTSRRNIASQYYYRLLKSQNKRVVEDEMHKLTEPFGFIFSKQYLLNLEILIMVRISRGVKLFTNWNRLICDCKRLLYLQNQNHLNTKAMKYIFPLPLLLVVSCYSSHMAIDWESPDSEEHKELFYCAETDTYIKPQKDPYRIENFQNALDSMLDDAADSKWTKAQRSFLEDLELVPTHYALRMYPRTEEQQWQLETMADISVSYIPFDYVPVLSEDIAGSQRSNVQSFDISGNIITYENLESTMGFIGSVSFNLPVLYVTWPVDKELPENIDYDVDYPIYIPKYETLTKSSLDFDVISTLEKKAIELALGQRGIDPKATKSTSVRGWFTVETYDCYLKKRVPVPHLKVRTQLGSNILDYYTDDNGRFNVALNISDDALVGFVFQHARWKLTTETSTSPRIGWKGTVGGFYENASCPVIFDAPSDQLYEVHRAVDFYYNSSHSIRTWHYDSGIRIIVSSESSSEANAYFTYSRTKPAYITVYDNNASARNKVIGSTLHELGHFTQYGERGGYKKYVSVQDLILFQKVCLS